MKRHAKILLALFLFAANSLGAMAQEIVRTKTLPTDGKAVVMAVLADRKFEECLKPYLQWKTQQGYQVEEIYTDEENASSAVTGPLLAAALRARLMEMDPWPAYVLIVGDEDEVPPFAGTTVAKSFATDFYFGEYTGDFFPEAYVGRFSGNTPEQIEAQMHKTKFMATLPAEKADWLTQSMRVWGPADNINLKRGAAFADTYPLLVEGNTVVGVEVTEKNRIKNTFDEGCSMVAYFGHGMTTAWDGVYGIADAEKLANKDRYPVVLGITCKTGTFDNGWKEIYCLAEQMTRMPEAGAVAYIGATENSYDEPNNIYYAGKKRYEDENYLGFMQSLFHLNGEEPRSQYSRTIGEANSMGSYASNGYSSGGQYYRINSEIYTLFGDPTYQPFITTPLTMSPTLPATYTAGHLVSVSSAPAEAVVCISRDREIAAVGVTDAEGNLSIKLPVDAEEGEYTLYASAPGYTDYACLIQVARNDGTEDEDPFATTNSIPLDIKYTDVLTAENLDTHDNQWKSWDVTDASGAEYNTWVSGHSFPCIHMQNNYVYCGIVTTKSAGMARQVTINWSTPNGQLDRIAVYGSQEAYRVASDVWDESLKGELLGTIAKTGAADSLVIKGDYPYIALRAENLACYMESIAIGWGDKEDPTGTAADRIQGNTPNASRQGMYDLQGRRSQQNGIIIKDNKKFINRHD